jgi:hypothetical protein
LRHGNGRKDGCLPCFQIKDHEEQLFVTSGYDATHSNPASLVEVDPSQLCR